jgi:hypothetical protein
MDMIGSIGSIALALVLVGSAVLARQRMGQPMARYGLIWAVIVAAGFAVAFMIDRHAQ